MREFIFFLDFEPLVKATDTVSSAIEELKRQSGGGSCVTLDVRIRLCRQCLDGLLEVADEWIRIGAEIKLCPNNASVLAEELLSGPAVISRQLRLTMQTLRSLIESSRPRLPRSLRRLQNGQLAVSVFPTVGFFDSLTFSGISAQVRLPKDVDESRIHGDRLDLVRSGALTGLTAVLGAGNVSSIPITDCLNRIMFDGRQVVLKMNPVNERLAGCIKRAFAPLMQHGLLRVITGGGDVGNQLVNHPDITDVHVTGSVATHDLIVWGSTPEERERRKRTNGPLLKKPVTSELGNVSPWIIVPGRYSKSQLRSQARHLVASMTNNAGFNCLTTRLIITWDRWDQRAEFLELLDGYLAQTPLRPAWYPGAAERYRKFAANGIDPDDKHCLPWTLLKNQSIRERPELYEEESFACVCADSPLGGNSPIDFINRTTEFLNEEVFGTLCASVTFPNHLLREQAADVARCLERLRYGTVCVNQWSGLAYGLVSLPWGGHPGATLSDTDSGIGNVHNTYLLDRYEKTVLEGPLINFPKPAWFPGHKTALKVAQKLLALYDHTSVTRLPPLFAAALMG